MRQENIVDQQHQELTSVLRGIKDELAKSVPSSVASPTPIVNVDVDLNAIAVELQTLNSLLRLLIEALAKQNSIPVVLPGIPPVPALEARKKILGIF